VEHVDSALDGAANGAPKVQPPFVHLSVSKNQTHSMNQSKIQPVGDRILIQHLEEKEQIKGGVIIPDSAKEKPQEAKVIALGTGRKGKDGVIIPFEVKVGDKVLVAKWGGAEVKLNEKKYTLVREDDLLGILA
jgi:chaperonin GroES